MKSIVIMLAGTVVFGGAAAGSWYARTHLLAVPAKESTVEAKADLTSAPLANVADADGEGELMPVAVRQDSMSVEELLRFSLGLKEREKVLKETEERFRQEQVQQQVVLTDIQAEQQAIDGLRAKLTTDIGSVQGMMEELNRLRESVISEREVTKKEFGDIEAKRIDISEQFRTNDKKLSTWLQGMSSENAAAVLKEMVNDGNMKIAVQLLANFEEREAAKILDSINDPKLLNEFIAEFRNLKNSKQGVNARGSDVR